jgi:hypothetical protein
MAFEHVGHWFYLHCTVTWVLESLVSAIFFHLFLFVPDSNNDSFTNLGDRSTTLGTRKLSEVGFLIIRSHHVFQVSHANTSFCGLTITASNRKSAFELIDHDVSSSAVFLFKRVLVFSKSGPVWADSPGRSIFTVDSSMLADVNCKVLFLIRSILVLNLVNISFPTRHVINYSLNYNNYLFIMDLKIKHKLANDLQHKIKEGLVDVYYHSLLKPYESDSSTHIVIELMFSTNNR